MTPLRHLAFALFVAAPVAWMAAPVAAAEADRDSALRWFDGVDTDRNQMIGAEEMTRVREKRFPRYDGDGDGEVSLDEFNFALPAELADEIERRARRFRVMDSDGDGSLDLEEYLAFGQRVLEAADINRDGIVTRDEFAQTVAPR